MEYVDYTDIYNKYTGKWVAFKSEPLNSTEVVGSGKTLKEALGQAKEKGILNPVVAKMPDFKYTYALS